MSGAPHIDVSIPCETWTRALPDVAGLCHRAAFAALQSGTVPAAAEAGVVLADDDLVQALNRDYRGRDAPTNVLAFGGRDEDRAPTPGAPVLLGDVVVAYGTAAAEAAAAGIGLADHLCHLVVHGMLHLLGHDHASEAAARPMEAAEVEILATLGIGDPYAPGGGPG